MKDLNKQQRRDYSSRKTTTTTITNTLLPGTAAHWLKNREMRQLDIQLDCVAATFVTDTWYFAANNLVIIDSDVATTLAELGTPWAKYCIVWDDTPNMHAEMKILKYLKSHSQDLAKIKMGVSKPCCPRCKDVLEKENVQYTSFHKNTVEADRWAAPF